MASHSLVVGGTRGIGRAVVQELVGGRVVSVIARRPPEAGWEVAHAHYWQADLLDSERLPKVIEEISDAAGPFGALVCTQRYRGDGDDWAGEMATSLDATKRLFEALEACWVPAGDKSAVIVSSVAGRFVIDDRSLGYHVAKAGLDQMVRALAARLGPRAIRVNAVSPGTVVKDESQAYYDGDPGLRSLIEQVTPLGRMGTAQDVARVVAFLVSEQASFVTGQNIVVDGGVSVSSQESLARRLSLGSRKAEGGA